MEASVPFPHGMEGDAFGGPEPLRRPDVSVAIVSYNTRDDLCRCLTTIRDAGSRCALEVIVVDNDSRDGSPDAVAECFPHVLLVKNDENVGYSRAVNQAIQISRGRFVLILNPDIEVVPGSIDQLVSHMTAHPQTGIAGGKLLNPDGTLQYSCRTFYTLPTLLLRRTPLGKIFPQSSVIRRHLMLDWDHASTREVDWMLGACLMVRAEAIREVGLMDERFFMYFEDVDWCYRMKQHGWSVMYVPEAVMKHVHKRESASGGGFQNRRLRAHLQSMFLFFDKWNLWLYRVRKRRDAALGTLLLGLDAVAVNGAFLIAFAARSELHAYLRGPVFPLASYGAYLLLLNAVIFFVNAVLGLYRNATSRDLFDDAVDLAKGLGFSTLVLMASTFLTKSELYSRMMVALFVPTCFLLMMLARWGIASIATRLRHHRFDLTRAILLGERSAVEKLARELTDEPLAGYEVVAAVPDRPTESERRFREVWDPRGLRETLSRNRVAEVLLTRPTLTDHELARFLLVCRREGVRVRLVSGLAELLPSGVAVSSLVGRPLVDLSGADGESPMGEGLRHGIERGLGAVALLVSRPGSFIRELKPPSAAEVRGAFVGRHGRVIASRALPGEGFPLDVALGHLLRGEMAVVGPRPRPLREIESDEGLRVVYDLSKPGLTGPWKFMNPSERGSEAELSLALSALQNRSLLGDLKLVLKSLVRPRATPSVQRRNP